MSLVVKNPSKTDFSISVVTKSVNSRGHQLSTTNDTVFLCVPLRISAFSAIKVNFNAESRREEHLLSLTFAVDDPQQGSDGDPCRTLRTVRLRLVAPRRPGDIEMRPGNSIRKFL